LKDASGIGYAAQLVSKTVAMQRQAKTRDFTDTLSSLPATD
jgi:hypothetical protein